MHERQIPEKVNEKGKKESFEDLATEAYTNMEVVYEIHVKKINRQKQIKTNGTNNTKVAHS